MSRPGIEPGSSQANTLAKSYSNSLCCYYSEPLQYRYLFMKKKQATMRDFFRDMFRNEIPRG
jgi:hypothetical protein